MIELNQIRAGYGKEEILRGISFKLEKGERLSIVGPNGCGKTTLLRVAAGALPYSGEVKLDGISIKKMKRKQLAKKISMLSQITRLYFNYTVFDIVMMGRYAHGDGIFGISESDKQAVEAALKASGIFGIKDREADTLSGGQLQRVFLAKIIAQDPEIILLDEPTNHLDLSYQIELIDFLKNWSLKKQKTVVGVLHDINLAMSLSDNVLLMENGIVRAYGKNRDVFSSGALKSVYKIDVAEYMRQTLRRWEDI